jgi:hypothetical protein
MSGDASRNNGRRSRGPKTPEGKSAIRFNSQKHGLFSSAVLVTRGMFAESGAELDRHRRAIFDALQPVGGYEELLADRLAAISWRLRRPARVEAVAFAAIAERVEHAPRCSSRLPSPMERSLASPFDDDMRAPPCDCGAAARIGDNDGAERRLRTSVACLDLLRSVVRSEAHLSREVARTWALLAASQRERRAASGTPSALPLLPDGESRPSADEAGDSADRT